MARTPFDGSGWTLSETQRGQARALKEALASVERHRAMLAGIEAAIHAQAYAMAVDVMMAMPGRPSSYEVPIRAMAGDLAAVTHLPDTTVRARMERAAQMLQRFPAVHAALCEGRLAQNHAQAICDEGAHLGDTDRRTSYEQTALRLADTTPAKLRRICQVIAERLEPTSLEERHEAAVAGRSVWATPACDGMTELHLLVETVLAEATMDRLTQIARGALAAPTGGAPSEAAGSEADPDTVLTRDTPVTQDTRTLAQARVDVAMDLLLTAVPTAQGEGLDRITATVQVTIPADTLADTSGESAHTGSGTLVAPQVARRLAGRTHTWARLFRHPTSGALTAVDTYVPTAEQRRFLVARDEHCRFPGCRRAVRRCDLDHIHDYAQGGRTDVGNLAALCRAHHVVKHHSPWSYRHLGDGVMEWTSPTGSVLREDPNPVVRFRAAASVTPSTAAGGDPPPF